MLRRTGRVRRHTSAAFAATCAEAGVRQSVSAVGSSGDNALAESSNAAFERETFPGRKNRPSEHEGRLDAFRWLHRYDTRRRHFPQGDRGVRWRLFDDGRCGKLRCGTGTGLPDERDR